MKINITETVLRDANQSLMATRLPLADFETVLDLMDQAGYHSIECWGGATFDACLRYLGENPWERLRIIRRHMKNTKLQMLLRGQNLLGYHHYSNDTVRRFVRQAIADGIDILRIFDGLNDLRNIETAVDECLKAGGHAQGAICYTISPIHNLEMYVGLGRRIEEMGCHSLCIKDMSGIMSPKECFDLVRALRQEIRIPIFVHTHMTTGLGGMTYLKAAEAGADGIDCATSCFAGGTSQPATESLVYALSQMGFDCGVHFGKLQEINRFFEPLRDKFVASGVLDPYVLGIKADTLVNQIPGGMLSNLIAQLKTQHAVNRLDEVLAESPRVRKDLGYPPLVTPMCQLVGVQATLNVLLGERYKSISRELLAYIRGEYGAAPGEIDPALTERALGGKPPVTGRYADRLEPEFDKAKAHLAGRAQSDEDVLSYVLFPEQAEQYFKMRESGQLPAAVGRKPEICVAAPIHASMVDDGCIRAPLIGVIRAVKCAAGQAVKKGEMLFLLEAMKLENEILAPRDGIVTSVLVAPDATVDTDDPLCTLQ